MWELGLLRERSVSIALEEDSWGYLRAELGSEIIQ